MWIGLALLFSVQKMSNKKDLEAIYFIKTMKDLELSLVHGVIVSILYLCLFLGAAQLGPITHRQDPLNGRVGQWTGARLCD